MVDLLEWGDRLSKETPQILPPFYFYFKKKKIKDKIKNHKKSSTKKECRKDTLFDIRKIISY